jgi:RNA polymerase sigma-70 factor (ECF subfamily)
MPFSPPPSTLNYWLELSHYYSHRGETFVKVHQSLKNFRGESQLSTWMYRIATNTALDKLRSPSFQRVVETSMLGDLDETDMADKVVWGEEKKPMIEKQLVKE